MNELRVKNWSRFQHYGKKDTPPPWIKLHISLLTDHAFDALTPVQRYQLIAIWMLASKKGGVISGDAQFVARKIGVKRLSLAFFVEQGWLEPLQTSTKCDKPF